MNMVESNIDSQFWHACAGGIIQMPLPNSHVYYFPQGHAEHAHANVDFHQIPLPRIPPCILCKVIDVKFLAHLQLEEVYAKIRLIPLKSDKRNLAHPPTVADKLSCYVKTLTHTDANVFLSVPRDKAETVFPELIYSENTSSQTIIAKDIHGKYWTFKHVCRGEKRRHTLTSGWKYFVRKKNLVEGKSVVFTQGEYGDLRVGIILDKVRNINSRGRGRVTPGDVIKAVSLAVNGQEFEITYYPRSSSPEFVVKASSVDAAERAQWKAETRVWMVFETKDLSKESWFTGTVSAVEDADPLWPKSPWRCLQVNWDDKKDVLRHEMRVNPWLVQDVSITQVNHPSYKAKKTDGVVSSNLCEVFLEYDDYCYGTLDLNVIGSYEELEKTLKDMFDINKFDDTTYVIYNDSTGVSKRMCSDEPYREFAKAKKLTVSGYVYDLDE